MISDELRRALEKLNRGPLKVQPERSRDAGTEVRKSVSIEHIAPARVLSGAEGACVVFERSLGEFFEDPKPIAEPFRKVFLQGHHAFGDLPDGSDWKRLLSTDASGIVFLDIETLGLGGAPIFLVGIIHCQHGELLIRQFFARDYSEEAFMLSSVVRALGTCRCLVTFNGKTFDVPMLTDRMTAHLLETPPLGLHFDLLHESRRRFRRVLPNCKLQTLEYHICHRRRFGDVPGELIPQLYHDFVATGDAAGIRNILHHNALDLVAMVEILTFMAEGGELVWTD